MKIAFLDTETLGDDLDLTVFQTLGEVSLHRRTSPDQRVAHLAGVNVAILNKVKIDWALLQACPDLKLVALTATGYNNIDLEAARDLGVAVANVPAYSTASVAQHTLALTLALAGHLPWLNAWCHTGDYSRSGSFTHLSRLWHELTGRTWGIVGMGHIGRQVALLAEALGAKVVHFSASGRTGDSGWPQLAWEDFLAACDVVTIHAPLSEKTRGLFDRQALRKMKPGALLVNTGRGGIVDEAALAEVLDSGHLGGAALDVLEQEPPSPDNPLLRLQHPDRLLLTPHTAWASVEARRRCLHEVYLNVQAFAAGQTRNRVDHLSAG